MAKQWPAKGPNETLRSGLNWAPELGDDTIATSVYTLVNAAGLTIESQSNTDTTTTVILSGGTAGEYGVLLNVITTAAGDTLDEEIYLPIEVPLTSGGYGSDAGFTAWLTSQGYELPAGSPPTPVLRQRGSAYVDGLYGIRFPGHPTGGLDQERAWPRTGATAMCAAIGTTIIPSAVIRASYFAGWHEANNPGSLSIAVSAASQVKSEEIGPIKTTYFGSGDALKDQTPTLSAVEGLLAPFLKRAEIGAVYVV